MSTQSLVRVIAVSLCLFSLAGRTGHCQQPAISVRQDTACPETGCVWAGTAQSPPDQQPRPAEADDQHTVSFKRVFLNLPGDQKAIWTSPFHLRKQDASWFVPFAATTGTLIGSDQHNMERAHFNPDAITLSNHVADGGLIGMAAVPATMYVWGSFTGAPRARETGLLSGEAMINSLAVNEVLKLAFARERPTPTDGRGRFYQTLGNSASFPSAHAILGWTAASVIAHEYPSALTQTLVYGAASTISIARITGRQHFPSDVVVGSALGWLIGRQVYRAHHDRELDHGDYGNFFIAGHHFAGPQTGTTYVAMDSWVYPALDRLAAMGYINTAETGMRPWTRAECARLVEEASQSIDSGGPSQWPEGIYKQLAAEFAPEMKARATQPETYIEEVYTGVGGLSGQSLADDFHFAKTIIDDFGRPFGQGANAVAGASARAIVGPLAFYVRGEYQHAGTLPAQNSAAQAAIARQEGLPFAPPQRTATLDRLRALDAYVSFNFHNNLVSFGKQTLWWGPGADGPFLFSNNAEPLPLLRITRASPFVLPWLFRLMGPIRIEFLWGQLGGQQFVALFDGAGNRTVVNPPLHPHPMIQGEKISFKPTRNLEFGFGVTAIWSGPGFPLTLHTLLRSYSLGNASRRTPTIPVTGDQLLTFPTAFRDCATGSRSTAIPSQKTSSRPSLFHASQTFEPAYTCRNCPTCRNWT